MRKYMIFCSSLERVFGWNGSDTRWQFCMQSFAIILGIQKNVVLKVNVSKLFVRWMELLQCF